MSNVLEKKVYRSLPWVPEDIFFFSILMRLGSFIEPYYGLFNLRYFENADLWSQGNRSRVVDELCSLTIYS